MTIRSRLLTLALAVAAFGVQAQQSDKVNLGVAIPAATHAFTAGIVFSLIFDKVSFMRRTAWSLLERLSSRLSEVLRRW